MPYKCPLINGRKCPESNSKDGGCPAWADGILESNALTSEQRVTSDCMFRLLPRWLLQGYSNTDGVRAEMSAMRGAVAAAVSTTVAHAIENGNDIPVNMLSSGEED